jgi:hypothetical protein
MRSATLPRITKAQVALAGLESNKCGPSRKSVEVDALACRTLSAGNVYVTRVVRHISTTAARAGSSGGASRRARGGTGGGTARAAADLDDAVTDRRRDHVAVHIVQRRIEGDRGLDVRVSGHDGQRNGGEGSRSGGSRGRHDSDMDRAGRLVSGVRRHQSAGEDRTRLDVRIRAGELKDRRIERDRQVRTRNARLGGGDVEVDGLTRRSRHAGDIHVTRVVRHIRTTAARRSARRGTGGGARGGSSRGARGGTGRGPCGGTAVALERDALDRGGDHVAVNVVRATS